LLEGCGLDEVSARGADRSTGAAVRVGSARGAEGADGRAASLRGPSSRRLSEGVARDGPLPLGAYVRWPSREARAPSRDVVIPASGFRIVRVVG
jgi:hypothetical protein